MSDSLSRVLRTVLQVAVALGAGIPSIAALFNLSAAQTAKVAGAVAVLTVLVTAVQNALEGKAVPTLLKPSGPEQPQSTTAP